MLIAHSSALSIQNHCLRFSFADGKKHIDFHDTIKKGKTRYYLFHEKTGIAKDGNDLVVRTAAINEEDFNAPIPGLMVTYRFHLDDALSAFHVSVSFGSDMLINDCAVKLMDITTEGMAFNTCMGYEEDATGKPFTCTFPVQEPSPDAPDYEARQHMTSHTLLEKNKNPTRAFRDALALSGPQDYLAVIGGFPSFVADIHFLSVFPNMEKYDGDLRFFSGKNSPGAWFLLQEPEDFFAQMKALREKAPVLPGFCMVPSCKKSIHLSAGALQADILQSKGGLWITPIEYEKGTEKQQPFPLFSLQLWDTQYQRDLFLDAGYGWDRIAVMEQGNYTRITLSDPENGRVTGISIILEAFCDAKKHRITWKVRGINCSERWAIVNLSYPNCLSRGFDTGMLPHHSGMLRPHYACRSNVFSSYYPNGATAPMAFFALYQPMPLSQAKDALNGLYIAVHDPDGSKKYMHMAGAAASGCVLASIDYPASYQHHAGNTVTLPGEMVWQRFSGDWFDATNLYREFVHTRAAWFPQLRGRPDTPQWMREMPMWIMFFLPNINPDANPLPISLRQLKPDPDPSAWYRLAIRLQKALGVPIGYHVYNWHWVPFNNDNPHYFPAHHDFKEGVSAMHEAGIKVIPYIAGYSWDMKDHRGEDYRFQNEALPHTAKDINGDTLHTSYASTKPNGAQVKFGRMCPTTAFWKKEVRQIVRKLYTDYDIDGIYLDVISSAYNHCCDESHPHAPGNGHFWGNAYQELIHSLRIDAPEDFAIVSESVAEVYASALDGYLSWLWSDPDLVPAFPRVYSGYTAAFGRRITKNKRTDDFFFRFHAAQSVMFGQQIGWFHPDVVDDEKQFPFLKKMVQLRWNHRKFFAEAEMMRPPEITGDIPLLDTESTLRIDYLTHEKGVVASGWEDAAGGRQLFVINAADQETDCVLKIPADEYRLPDRIQMAETDGCTLEKTEEKDGMRFLHCHIEKEGYGVIAWQK